MYKKHLAKEPTWERFVLAPRTLFKQALISVALAAAGFTAVALIYAQTSTYFPSITILTVIAISIFGTRSLSILLAIILSVLTDYYFVPPLGSILIGQESLEHCAIVIGLGILASLTVSRLRDSLLRMYAAKQEAEKARQDAETLVEKRTLELSVREDDLRQAKECAEAANLAKSAFLANMSHEIRTPLGAVMGFSELICVPEIDSNQRVNFISIIKRNGDLLSNIIGDILDLSKVEAGKLEVVVRDESLLEIIEDTKSLLELKAREKGVEITFAIDDNVPEVIKTDALRLRQILMNIVGNALKFTDKGSVRISVRSDRIEQNTRVSFVVEDTGKGIDADQIGRLFSSFSQAHTSRRFGGTGLGLALSRRLANLLGGDIVLTETIKGKGSIFTITIDPGPLQARVKRPIEGSKVKTFNSENKRRLNKLRILVVDDAPDMQLLTTHILHHAGAAITVADNGLAALEKIGSESFDLVLMDIQMPLMDGYEAIRQLRKTGYRGNVVALTAHALGEEKDRCIAAGFDSYLSKPINIGALIERVESLCIPSKTEAPDDRAPELMV